MKTLFLLVLLSISGLAENGPTLCVTYRILLNGKAMTTPAGSDQMMTEKLSKIGYTPAPCPTAQIRLTMAMRVTGETRENTDIKLVIDGKNGSRIGHYETKIPAEQFERDKVQMFQLMALGLGSVMTQIDRDYPKKVLAALQNELGKQ